MVEAAAKANGFTDIFLTKLDVLTGWEKIPVCVGYRVNGRRYDTLPVSQSDFHHAAPIYEELDGWTEDISAGNSRTCPRMPRPTSTASRSCAAPRFPGSV